jgi:hypothetical protein
VSSQFEVLAALLPEEEPQIPDVQEPESHTDDDVQSLRTQCRTPIFTNDLYTSVLPEIILYRKYFFREKS